MIEIRPLSESNMEDAVDIKLACWTEELAGKAENTLSKDKQLAFWTEWMHTAQEHQDVRLLLGAFENERLLGVAFASLAEAEDISQNGIELNGLWVDAANRNRGISLRLLNYVFDFYRPHRIEKMVIYTPHYAPSNSYYQKFGATVVKQELQMNGKLPVDVMIAYVDDMQMQVKKALTKYWRK
ncbi:MAG: GNAT family N-acetyltransferase [Clostridiales bacterium]|nr:GNAT family N-acetyltransferase [Clostridiales bacterium]